MSRCVLALLMALAIVWASPLSTVSAQEMRDPIVDPPSGGAGSRFQIVGQSGWTPGETVTLTLWFTTAGDPLTAPQSTTTPSTGFKVTVLGDGTWSFPIVVDELFANAGGAPRTPGYIVVRAEAPSHEAVNAYVYTVRSVLPAGADAIVSAGSGPGALPVPPGTLAALFAGAIGVLLVAGGALRRASVAS